MAEGSEKEIVSSLQEVAKRLELIGRDSKKSSLKQDRSLQNINDSIKLFNKSASAIAEAPALSGKESDKKEGTQAKERAKEQKQADDKRHEEEMTIFEEILEALNIKQKDQKKEDESWWEGLFDYGLFSWVMLGVAAISGILVGIGEFLYGFGKALFKGLLYPFKLLKKGILSLGKRFKPIQKIIDSITKYFRNLKAMFLKMGRAIKGISIKKVFSATVEFAKKIKKFAGIFTRFLGKNLLLPFKLIMKGMSKLGKIFKPILKIFDPVSDAFKKLKTFFLKMGTTIGKSSKIFESISKVWTKLTGVFSNIGSKLKKGIDFVLKPFKNFFGSLRDVGKFFLGIGKRLGFVGEVGKKAKGFFSFFGKIKKVFTLFRTFGRFLGPVVSIVMGLIDAFKGGMKGLDEAGEDASMFKKISYFIVGALQGFFEGAIGSIVTLLRDGLGWILRSLGLDGLADIFDDFFNSFLDGFGSIFAGIKDIINGDIWDGIKKIFGGLLDIFTAAPKFLFDLIWGGIKWLGSAIWDGIVWVFDKVTGFWIDIFDRIWDAVSGIFDGFAQIFSGDISGGLESIATSFLDILWFIPNLIKDYIVTPVMEFFGVNMDSQFMTDFKNMSLGELFMKYVIDPLVEWFDNIDWSSLNPLNWFGGDDEDDKKASGGYLRRAASGNMVNGPTLVNEQGPEAYTERKSGKTYLMGGDGYVHNANATKDLLQKSEQSAMAKNEAPPPPMAPPIINAGGGGGGSTDNSTTITNNFIDSYSLKAAVNRSAVLV